VNGEMGNRDGTKLRLRTRNRTHAIGRCMGLAVVDSTLLTLGRGGMLPIGALLIGSISHNLFIISIGITNQIE
jgi:hypothetical protein